MVIMKIAVCNAIFTDIQSQINRDAPFGQGDFKTNDFRAGQRQGGA